VPNKAAAFIRKEFAPILGKAKVKLPDSEKEFFKKLLPSLYRRILGPLELVHEKRVLGVFVDRLYAIYVIAIDEENRNRIEQDPSYARRYLHTFGLARDQLNTILEPLREAENALGIVAKDLAPGVVDFRPAKRAVSTLIKNIQKIERLFAFAISPKFRTKTEKELAKQVRIKRRDGASSRKNSAEPYRQVITAIEKEVQRINRERKISTNQIELFIQSFLNDLLGQNISIENVNILRRRMRKRDTNLRSQLAPSIDSIPS